MSNTYTIRVYENTGFNAVNIPLNKSVVNSSAISYKECKGLTLTQPRFLSTINVPLKYSDVNNADYCIIWAETEGTTINDGWCYFITNASMQAEDVASLQVVPDYLTSAGGVDNIAFIDGIVTRSTHALYHEQANKLNSGDPYLAPSETMTIQTEWLNDGNQGVTFIDSTFDITGTCYENEAQVATPLLQTVDPVAYPIPVYANPDYEVKYKLSDGQTIFSGVGTNAIIYDKTLVQAAYFASAQIGLAKLRGMGLENGILHQVFIPSKYVTPTIVTDGSAQQQYKYYVTQMEGKWGTDQTTIAMKQYGNTNPEDEVLNFSEFSKYGIMSASGESIEADPKDLMTTSNPSIKYVGDPRPEGRPYFRFEKLHNDTVSSQDFFRSCISGLPWKNIPLVFSMASGNALNTARYNATRTIADIGYRQAQRGYELQTSQRQQNYDWEKDMRVYQVGTSAISGLTSTLGSNPANGLSSIAQMANIALDQARANLTNAQAVESQAYSQLATAENYATSKMADALAYGIQQNVQVPTVMFPYNAEIIRDFYGNGVLVYRYIYTDNDANRIKKIIRAYGVKYTEKITKAHFIPEANKDFAYVEASGVSIADKPQWLSNGVSMQLANGVRVWRGRPHSIA